jgi:predicted ATPase
MNNIREYIYIKNLGPINEIEINNLLPITFFIGDSGSGKSTLIKTIALFRWLNKMVNIRSYLKNVGISKSPFRFVSNTLLKNSGIFDYCKSDTIIKYTYSINGNDYTIEYRDKSLKGTNSIIDKEDISYQKIAFMSEMRVIIPDWADRGARFAGGYLNFHFHESYGAFDDATNAISDLKLDFIGMEFSVKKSGNTKKFYLKPSMGKGTYEALEFKKSSSGMQSSIPLAVVANYYSKHFDYSAAFRNSVIQYLLQTDKITSFKEATNLSDMNKQIHLHIEEPELSLYPDAQCKLINFIVEQSFISNVKDREITMTIATHSPYIINQLNVLLRAYQRGKLFDNAAIDPTKLAVYRLYEGKLQDLVSVDETTKEKVVNTYDLSETINDIYNNYENL